MKLNATAKPLSVAHGFATHIGHELGPETLPVVPMYLYVCADKHYSTWYDLRCQIQEHPKGALALDELGHMELVVFFLRLPLQAISSVDWLSQQRAKLQEATDKLIVVSHALSRQCVEQRDNMEVLAIFPRK